VVTNPSVWSRTFSSPIVVATVTNPARDSPVATSRIAACCCAGRCWCMVSPPWSVGV
jgi:hypothetical protein